MRLSFSAAARAASSIRLPRAVLTRKAPAKKVENSRLAEMQKLFARKKGRINLTWPHLFNCVFIDQVMVVFVQRTM